MENQMNQIQNDDLVYDGTHRNSVIKTITYKELYDIHTGITLEEETGRAIINTPKFREHVLNVSGTDVRATIIALLKEYGHFDILRVEDVPDENNFSDIFLDQIASYGIVFEGSKELTNVGSSLLAILPWFNNDEELRGHILQYEKLYNISLGNLTEVYIDYPEMEFEHFDIANKRLQIRNKGAIVVYHNELSKREYYMKLEDVEYGHVQANKMIKLSELLHIVKKFNHREYNVDVNNNIDVLNEFFEAIKSSGADAIDIDTSTFSYSFLPVLSYVHLVMGVKIILRSSMIAENYIDNLTELQKRSLMLIEDRVPTFEKEGIKLYYSKRMLYLYLIDSISNHSKFLGIKLSDVMASISLEKDEGSSSRRKGISVNTDIYKQIRIKPTPFLCAEDDGIPNFKSIKSQFGLDVEDAEEFSYNAEIFNRVLFLLEYNLYNSDRLLNVRDIAIIEIDGEDYIGTFEFDLTYHGYLVSLNNGKATIKEYIFKHTDAHKLIDLDKMVDYENHKDNIANIFTSFTDLTREEVIALMETKSNLTGLDNYLPAVLDIDIADKYYKDNFYKHLYDNNTYKSSNHIYKVIRDYLSMGYLRAKGNGTHVDIFGKIRTTSKASRSVFFVNYQMFEMSTQLIKTTKYFSDEVFEDL